MILLPFFLKLEKKSEHAEKRLRFNFNIILKLKVFLHHLAVILPRCCLVVIKHYSSSGEVLILHWHLTVFVVVKYFF